MSRADVPPCVECGACCAGEPGSLPGEPYVSLSTRDVKRLPGHPRRNLLVIGTHRRLPITCEDWTDYDLRTKRNKQGLTVCVGLSGEVGKRVSCSLYAVRPTVCRSFEPGSKECHEARKCEGLE